MNVIGISSFLCWNKSDSFADGDFELRKCSAKFDPVKKCEDMLLSLEREHVKPCIIAPGVLYGEGEDKSEFGLFPLLQSAWLCKPVTHIDTKLVLPSIHVVDLAKVVFHVQSEPPEKPYILAIDESKSTLGELAKAVSETLGTGETKQVALESMEALIGTYGSVEAATFRGAIVPGYVAALESKGMTWECKAGPVSCVQRVCKEFTKQNSLLPIRIFLHGRPGSGKTFLANKLASKYGIKTIDAKALTKNAMNDEEIKKRIEDARAARKKAKDPAWETYMPPEVLADLVRAVLQEPLTRNKGFILDGFPNTLEEAKFLFSDQKPKEGEGKDVASIPTVDLVVDLQATAEEAEKRVQSIPVDQIVQGHNDEEHFKARVETYNSLDATQSPLEFFQDTKKIVELPFAKHGVAVEVVSDYVKKELKPCVLSEAKEESYAVTMKREEELAKAEEKAKADAQMKVEAEANEKKKLENEEAERRKQILVEEQAIVENYSMPLRKYLMSNVIPPLIKGLLEVCKLKPEDPIDYLAEYLYSHSSSQQSDNGKDESGVTEEKHGEAADEGTAKEEAGKTG
uniref:Adenylate kinase n=1 Tax=Norrisiella sphaerica TaxID=552664 RepID=A0A7S2QSA3_9EUKA|mmetsp:Transcript_1937/g.2768  ORF Transcript_1937/g.2768 Transcript_1937/m.2768 type:complete len:571 (+) Transcript_1937:3-1715(+)